MNQDKENIRFGMIAVQKGFVTPQHVVDALEIQVKENFSTGKHRLIGEILMDEGHLDALQLEEILGDLP
jgi:hypothetical protein